MVLASAGERRLGEFLEQRVGLALHDAIPVENRRAAERLGQVALAGPGRSEEEDDFALATAHRST